MALNTVNLGEIMSTPSTFAAYQSASPTPSIASGVSNYVYNGGMVTTDLTRIYGGSPTVTPAASSPVWNNILSTVGQVANIGVGAANAISAVKTAFTAPGTSVVGGTSSGSPAPVSVSITQPQASPILGTAVSGQSAQGSQATAFGLDTNMLMIAGAGILLLMLLMRK